MLQWIRKRKTSPTRPTSNASLRTIFKNKLYMFLGRKGFIYSQKTLLVQGNPTYSSCWNKDYGSPCTKYYIFISYNFFYISVFLDVRTDINLNFTFSSLKNEKLGPSHLKNACFRCDENVF